MWFEWCLLTVQFPRGKRRRTTFWQTSKRVKNHQMFYELCSDLTSFDSHIETFSLLFAHQMSKANMLSSAYFTALECVYDYAKSVYLWVETIIFFFYFKPKLNFEFNFKTCRVLEKLNTWHALWLDFVFNLKTCSKSPLYFACIIKCCVLSAVMLANSIPTFSHKMWLFNFPHSRIRCQANTLCIMPYFLYIFLNLLAKYKHSLTSQPGGRDRAN